MTLIPVQRRPLRRAKRQLNLKQRQTEKWAENLQNPTGNDRDVLLRVCHLLFVPLSTIV